MKIKNIIKEILEAKQTGYLYHVLDSDKLKYVLEKDILPSPNSFSRNIRYDYIVGRFKPYSFQLKIDGEKLSENYKIKPINQGDGWVQDEYEEIVNKNIKNVGKYIIDLIVLQRYEKRMYSTYSSTAPFHFSNELSNLIKTYLSKYPHIKIKTKTKEGNLIDDDKWLRSIGIKNPKEEEISNKVEGIYKDKKLITRDLNLIKFIESNLDKIYTKDLTDDESTILGKEAKIITLSKVEDKEELSSIIYGEDGTLILTDKLNNYIILKQIRNKNNQIVIQILGNENTKKDLDFYLNLISKTKKSGIFIDVNKNYYQDEDEYEF